MVDIDKAIIARLNKQGREFEILIDCEKAVEFREGRCSLDEVLATDAIYSDVKKGKHAPVNDLKAAFDTTDQRKIAEIIVREARLQLTAEYQKKLREQKIKQIVNLIHRNAVDPKTNIPHPALRIENALKEARVRIDDHKTAEEQITNIISQLKSILPIKYEISLIEVKIPASYSAKSFSTLKQYGKIQKEEWKDDGSLVVKMELPAGLQQELFDHINNITHGSVETKILK